MRRRTVAGLILLGLLAFAAIFIYQEMSRFQHPSPPPPPGVGEIVDIYRGVAVYSNGPDIVASWGRNFDESGYYFGQKWQCVEFIKRFYFQAKHHEMPDVMGHAKDFFDPSLASGSLNPRRALIQFSNGGTEPPQPDDLLVWNRGNYGHVAIVTEVGEDYVEFIQQNISGFPRARMSLKNLINSWVVGDDWQPAGWLRKPAVRPDASLLAAPDPSTPRPGDP